MKAYVNLAKILVCFSNLKKKLIYAINPKHTSTTKRENFYLLYFNVFKSLKNPIFKTFIPSWYIPLGKTWYKDTKFIPWNFHIIELDHTQYIYRRSSIPKPSNLQSSKAQAGAAQQFGNTQGLMDFL